MSFIRRLVKEGGTLNFYGTLAQINAERISAGIREAFSRRSKSIMSTPPRTSSPRRAITEARGGQVFSDVFQMALENVLQLLDQKLTVDWLAVPEAAAYPAILRAAIGWPLNVIIIVGAWNTNMVKKEDEPKQFDDFADPRNGRAN